MIRRLTTLLFCHLPPPGLILAAAIDHLNGRNHAQDPDDQEADRDRHRQPDADRHPGAHAGP